MLAYAVDRLSRNQNQIGVLFDEIQQAGARLEFVTERFEDTAVGRFILAARAFVGEVEREKMGERTTRGKLERARSGRIPQGFGSGCYGYVYNPATGQREIEPFQAEVVRRIFTRYTELRSFDRVSHELNEGGITTFDGGRWHPIGVKRVLQNESYTGRLIYRSDSLDQGPGQGREDAPEAPSSGRPRIRSRSPARRPGSSTRHSGSGSSRS